MKITIEVSDVLGERLKELAIEWDRSLEEFVVMLCKDMVVIEEYERQKEQQ